MLDGILRPFIAAGRDLRADSTAACKQHDRKKEKKGAD
jgi:hypothetical protein